MASTAATVLKISTIIFLVGGLALCITATASRSWVTGSAFNSGRLVYDIKSGIWDYCLKTLATDNCSDVGDLSNSEGKIRVIRGFMLLAIVGYVISLIVSSLSFPYKIFNIPLIFLLSLTTIFQAIAMGVSSDAMKDLSGPPLGFNWSYNLGWAGFGVSILATIFSIIMTIADKRS